MLLLYTDGLIENPSPEDPHHRDGERRLLDHLDRRATFDMDAMLRELGPDGFEDDVAVMAITTGR
jgi:hypothetical protein